MNDNAAPFIAIALIAGVYYVSSRRETKKYYQGLRAFISNVTMDKGGFAVDLHIQNPNSKGVIVKSVVGDFFVNNKKVGDISRFATVTIAGNSESTLRINIKPKVSNIFDAVTDLLSKKGPIVTFFNGTINIDDTATPVQIRYTLGQQ